MDIKYSEIEKFGDELMEWYKGMFLKERLLHGEIMELILEAVLPLQEPTKDTDFRKLALLTLATRIFDDAEGIKSNLLRGLPNQAQMVLRDIVECIMLFRLFINNPEFAKRWMMRSVELQPGSINAELLKIGVHAREYAFYGLLSHEGHANFLASISKVQEEEVVEGMRSTFHFGSSRTPETMFFVRHCFLDMFFLLHILLIEPLSEYYFHNSERTVYMEWAKKVNKLLPRLEDLVNDKTIKGIEGTGELEQHIKDLVEDKMRLKEFKKILTEDGG